MTNLPEWVERMKSMNLASIQPDRQSRLLCEALSIAWEALESVANYPYRMDGKARQLGEDAMRRIEEIGK